jgi:hypothetical protein
MEIKRETVNLSDVIKPFTSQLNGEFFYANRSHFVVVNHGEEKSKIYYGNHFILSEKDSPICLCGKKHSCFMMEGRQPFPDGTEKLVYVFQYDESCEVQQRNVYLYFPSEESRQDWENMKFY